MAELLGKESGCFFATGTAAQHAALLALGPGVAPQACCPVVLVHPTSHLVHLDCLRDGPAQFKSFAASAAANARDFSVRSFGAMEEAPTCADVMAALEAGGETDVVVLEVPMRMNGGRTMALDEIQQASAPRSPVTRGLC